MLASDLILFLKKIIIQPPAQAESHSLCVSIYIYIYIERERERERERPFLFFYVDTASVRLACSRGKILLVE
jgi:hypothetical protein